MSRLREFYKNEAVPALTRQFNYKNVMAVPRLVKINVNMGLGEAIANAKILDTATEELAAITGQRPVVTKAKKSIAAFKLRQGMPIGVTVTLRGDRMYEFFDRLVNAALPRVRDFRGIPVPFLRRARKLHAGTARPADLSRDRLRQGGQGARHEHHHRDHGGDRRRGLRAC